MHIKTLRCVYDICWWINTGNVRLVLPTPYRSATQSRHHREYKPTSATTWTNKNEQIQNQAVNKRKHIKVMCVKTKDKPLAASVS